MAGSVLSNRTAAEKGEKCSPNSSEKATNSRNHSRVETFSNSFLSLSFASGIGEHIEHHRVPQERYVVNISKDLNARTRQFQSSKYGHPFFRDWRRGGGRRREFEILIKFITFAIFLLFSLALSLRIVNAAVDYSPFEMGEKFMCWNGSCRHGAGASHTNIWNLHAHCTYPRSGSLYLIY